METRLNIRMRIGAETYYGVLIVKSFNNDNNNYCYNAIGIMRTKEDTNYKELAVWGERNLDHEAFFCLHFFMYGKLHTANFCVQGVDIFSLHDAYELTFHYVPIQDDSLSVDLTIGAESMDYYANVNIKRRIDAYIFRFTNSINQLSEFSKNF